MLIRISMVLALAAAAACAPVVTHGPRVEPGGAFMSTVGVPRPFCTRNAHDECNGEMVPTWGLGARYGWAPRGPGGVGVLAGVTVPLLDPLGTELDGYLQAPAPGAWVYGGGALSSARHLLPYAQLGRVPAGATGWYLMLGYAHLFADPSLPLNDEEYTDRMSRPPRFWAPGAGVQTHFRNGRYTVYAQGAFGSYVRRSVVNGPPAAPDGPPTADTVDTRKPVRTLMVGVAWEVSFGDLRLPGRPFPPPVRERR
ncbi:MAG TPA: hypothetical protein VF541_15815 [Longimicrobium sp.]|jgi:hypothetical protein